MAPRVNFSEEIIKYFELELELEISSIEAVSSQETEKSRGTVQMGKPTIRLITS